MRRREVVHELGDTGNFLMNEREVFLNYIQAFEDAYLSGDWSKLIPCFSTDVIHDNGLGQEICGREAVINYLRDSTEGFDKLFDSRAPSFGDVTVTDSEVSAAWHFIYKKDGAPDLATNGMEVATVSGQSITRLNSIFEEGAVEQTQTWMSEYGKLL